jgi:hypothetical protein
VAVLSLFCCSTGACLANYALGVGVLGMPYAFSQSGLVLGAVVMVVITAIGIITATWLIDVRSRAAAELARAIASCECSSRAPWLADRRTGKRTDERGRGGGERDRGRPHGPAFPDQRHERGVDQSSIVPTGTTSCKHACITSRVRRPHV